jgi:hypothetical protein
MECGNGLGLACALHPGVQEQRAERSDCAQDVNEVKQLSDSVVRFEDSKHAKHAIRLT